MRIVFLAQVLIVKTNSCNLQGTDYVLNWKEYIYIGWSTDASLINYLQRMSRVSVNRIFNLIEMPPISAKICSTSDRTVVAVCKVQIML